MQFGDNYHGYRTMPGINVITSKMQSIVVGTHLNRMWQHGLKLSLHIQFHDLHISHFGTYWQNQPRSNVTKVNTVKTCRSAKKTHSKTGCGNATLYLVMSQLLLKHILNGKN